MAIRYCSTSTSDIDAVHTTLLALALLLTVSCLAPKESAAISYQFRSSDTTVSSRGILVPLTYVSPIALDDETFPLVIMAHGHGGSRHEQGSFREIAERLAARGIASVRMDFPGSGDSVEGFEHNNLTNMTADLLAARNFAITQPSVDKERVGLFGWSMGGRIVLLLGTRNDDFKLIATWSPVATNNADSMVSFLGGRSGYDELRASAAREGSVLFTTRWGQEQRLGLRWFEDLENSRPLDAIREFRGPLFVLYGDLDDVVSPDVSESLISAANNSAEVVRHVVSGADHGMGIFSDERALTEEAISTTVQFLVERL